MNRDDDLHVYMLIILLFCLFTDCWIRRYKDFVTVILILDVRRKFAATWL